MTQIRAMSLMLALLAGFQLELFQVHAARDQPYALMRHAEIVAHALGDDVRGHDHELAPAHGPAQQVFGIKAVTRGDERRLCVTTG